MSLSSRLENVNFVYEIFLKGFRLHSKDIVDWKEGTVLTFEAQGDWRSEVRI